ncbi:MAG: metallophosphoesterase family protein [Armatimonadota bacterium]
MTNRRFMVVCVAVALVFSSGIGVVQAQLTFTVFGDTRPGPNYERLHVTRTICERIVQHDPLFVIGTGDYIEGSTDQNVVRQQFSKFFEALTPLKVHGDIPVAFTTGNHDIRGSRKNVAIFEEYFGATYYSFDRNNAHFIILDSEIPGQEGRIKGEQWEWLVDDLEGASEARYVFVALHRPLFPVDGHIGSSMDVDIPLRDRLHQLLVKHDVTAVFCGHEHLYNYQQRHGVDYYITGGGGAPLYAKPDEGGVYHYIVVETGENGYTARVITRDGQVHDVRP